MAFDYVLLLKFPILIFKEFNQAIGLITHNIYDWLGVIGSHF